jgi:ABC-type arginine transport system ATPase subunit
MFEIFISVLSDPSKFNIEIPLIIFINPRASFITASVENIINIIKEYSKMNIRTLVATSKASVCKNVKSAYTKKN